LPEETFVRTARKLTAVAASAALVVSGALLSAPAAHAATISVTDVNCSTGTNTGTAITASPGDTLDFTATLTDCDLIKVPTSMVDSASAVTIAPSGSRTVSIAAGQYLVATGSTADFTSLQVTLSSSARSGTIDVLSDLGATGETSWAITITGGGSGGGGSSSSTAGSAPAPVIQQFGRPASGTCEEAAPADLNVAGVGSGGWGESWAQWVNGGTGGAVCTRTLSYVASGWTVS